MRRRTIINLKASLTFLQDNTYTESMQIANAVIAEIRDALQGSNQAVIAVDIPPAAWNAITASQTWITNDTAWKTLLDETPQLQKEVGTQLREQINSKRNSGQNLIFVFSLRDEKLFLYHLH